MLENWFTIIVVPTGNETIGLDTTDDLKKITLEISKQFQIALR